MIKIISLKINKYKYISLSKKLILLLFFFSFIPSFSTSGLKSEDDQYMKINKAFELYGAVFRQLAAYYIVEVDPEDLMTEGINGMLTSLDPYTNYIKESESDDIDFITNGSYSGIGVTVGIIDSMLTVIDIQEGFSAQKHGIKIGDIIYKADSSVVINKTNDELKEFTRGAPGTKVKITVLRNFNHDTLAYDVPREEIKVKNIFYSGFVNDSIAYIRLLRFTRTSAQEVRSALAELRRLKKPAGLILDLRDNPGGLLESAVEICEMFVPENSPIVTTRGRIKSDERLYKSSIKPFEPDLPLAILIDGGSASASEIVAGAIQDLDRGVIIGERSFGKGLVQSVFDLPFNSNLKVTTAKYYTPSGRCIQRLNYSLNSNKKKGLNIHHDSTYFTLHKRPVIESNGILPDSAIKNDILSDFVSELINKSYIFKFGTYYTSNHDTIPDEFDVDDKILNQFNEWLGNSGYEYKSKLNKQLDSIVSTAENENLTSKTLLDLSLLTEKIRKQQVAPIKKYNESLSKYIAIEILKRYKNDDVVYRKYLENDWYIQGAVDLLHTNCYNRILSPKEH